MPRNPRKPKIRTSLTYAIASDKRPSGRVYLCPNLYSWTPDLERARLFNTTHEASTVRQNIHKGWLAFVVGVLPTAVPPGGVR